MGSIAYAAKSVNFESEFKLTRLFEDKYIVRTSKK